MFYNKVFAYKGYLLNLLNIQIKPIYRFKKRKSNTLKKLLVCPTCNTYIIFTAICVVTKQLQLQKFCETALLFDNRKSRQYNIFYLKAHLWKNKQKN